METGVVLPSSVVAGSSSVVTVAPQVASVAPQVVTVAPEVIKAQQRKYLMYFMGATILTLGFFFLALLIMYWTDSLIFRPFTPTLPDGAFWMFPPSDVKRPPDEVAARVALIDSLLDE